jgi:hypothetical protein
MERFPEDPVEDPQVAVEVAVEVAVLLEDFQEVRRVDPDRGAPHLPLDPVVQARQAVLGQGFPG